ncbi:Sterigmatocystin 8-O-methyltransferase [Lecanosticta acicola]|uniref:Sterigmatocystin 8-O-methyltransferase n=1 Tax=Lecanosticta acicola TaxID=111012 RepID=A0AAI9EA39_9PEZI|nr:Sterigmatocystin 8-O-methyltransferase [Lecanosticta acicola]
MASCRSLLELANSISKDAAILDDYCEKNGLPDPSLDVNGGSLNQISDPDTVKAQERLITATRELHVLGMGSFASLRAMQSQPDIDMMTFSFITRYEIARKVPNEGGISFEDLAKDCGVPSAFVKRILRYAMTSYLFAERREGLVSHTAMSLLLKEHPFLHSISEIGTQERFPASAKVVEAMAKYPECDEPSKSGWGLANEATRPMFEEMSINYPDRATRFGKAMDAFAAMAKTDILIQTYDWASLGNARFVDVGGGKGHVCIELARRCRNMTFIVQDLPEAMESGQKQLPEDVKDRVQFMEANFFNPQPVHGADVYFLRAVFHNWPDKYCIQILQNLIPAMKKGARVIVHDPAHTLHMMVYFNAHDRDEAEWEALFAQADPRFKVVSLKKPDDIGYTVSRLCVLEAVWED